MAESQWKIRIMLFVREVDNTPENRQTFGAIFADNGSGESDANESKLFDTAVKLSVSGDLPAQAFGLETALLLPDMRDDMRAFLDTLPQVRYYVIANIDTAQNSTGDYIDSNKGGFVWEGTFTMQDALDDIFDERGLIVIPDENI